MIKLNKIILRIIIIVIYILAIGLLLFGISSVFSYLNTGADRNSMLHTEINKEQSYLPKVVWESVINEGRIVDNQTKKDVEKDYLQSWYIKQHAFKTNSKVGVFEYFTKQAREQVYNYLEFNESANIHIESTTLEHNIHVDFFSEDGKLIRFSDRNVIEYSQIFKNNVFVNEIKEKIDYSIVMLLEDGYWKIRHLTKSNIRPINTTEENLRSELELKGVKGINYYPKNSPWDMFGVQFDSLVFENDFALIKACGLNTVRIFIPYKSFGKGKVVNEKLLKLNSVLNSLQNNDLKAVITLFDFYGNYDVSNWSINQRYIEAIINSCKNHKAILAWDIKNEPDLDFDSRGERNVMCWLKEMTHYVKTIDSIHPITIGWSSPNRADLLANHVDFVSFHYYEDIHNLINDYNKLKKKVNNKPVLLQEFGLSSYSGIWNLFGSSKNDQMLYHKNIQQYIKSNNIQFMSWTLYDFDNIPNSVVGQLPWRKKLQQKYGFIDVNNNNKPSFKYISHE